MVRRPAPHGAAIEGHISSSVAAMVPEQRARLARVARIAAGLPLATAAAAAGADVWQAREALWSLPTRSGCAALAAESSVGVLDPAAVMALRWLAPAATRAAASGLATAKAVAAVGSVAGWEARVARDPTAPPSVGRAAAVSVAAVSCPPAALLRISGHCPERARDAVKAASDPALIARLVAGSEDPIVLAAAVANPHCAPSLVEQTALRWPSDYMRSSVMENPNASPRALRLASAISKGPEHHWRLVAAHPNCPGDVLADMLTADLVVTSATAARHRNCPPGSINEAARHRMWQTREAAAANPSCPPGTVRLLAGDATRKVSAAAIANPNCPLDLVASAAGSTSSRQRAAAAANPNSASRVLGVLLGDRSPHVRETAAANPSLAGRLLEAAAASDDSWVRAGAAANPAASAGTVQRLAADLADVVRTAAATNPATSKAMLEALTVDAAPAVRDAAESAIWSRFHRLGRPDR